MARVPTGVGDAAEQLFEECLELAPLGGRQRCEDVSNSASALREDAARSGTPGARQKQRPCATVWRRSALKQAVAFEAIDHANRGRVRDIEDTREEVDRLPRSEARVDERGGGARPERAVREHAVEAIGNGKAEGAEEVCLARLPVRYMHGVYILPTVPVAQTDRDYRGAFGPFDGRIWLNAAHQGPLPRVAIAAAEQALAAKAAPHRIADDDFSTVPRRLRELLGRVVGAPADEIILGNSASWGLQVLANGLPFSDGDEILVLGDEFPATVFPWLVCERRGAIVRRLELGAPVLHPQRLARELTPATRVVALNWVRSLTGHLVDLPGLQAVCADAGVHLVVNATQGVGALPLDVSALPVAAISCSGFKWLCGPYATGFAWIRPDVLESMAPVQAYWLALPDGVELDLNREGEHRLRDDLGARTYDVFGTANFLNFVPWSASLEYLLAQGLDRIAIYDRILVDHLIDGLAGSRFRFISPTVPEERAAIVVVSAEDAATNEVIHRRLGDNGIDVALRGGNLRLSPHLYNTVEEIERTVELLRASARAA